MSTFSVVIPTLNEEGVVTKLLDDLNKQSVPPAQIIVVDGNSDDATVKQAKEFETVTVVSTNRGVGHQRNIGASYCNNDVIIFLDADTRVPPDFLGKVQAYFDTHTFDIACPKYTLVHSGWFLKGVFAFFNFVFYHTQKIAPSGGGMCILVRKDFFTTQKGFREDINFEDMEMIRRLGKVGIFTIAPCEVYVSDRRFKKYGTLSTLLLYLRISIYFMFGKFEQAGKINYPFGKY